MADEFEHQEPAVAAQPPAVAPGAVPRLAVGADALQPRRPVLQVAHEDLHRRAGGQVGRVAAEREIAAGRREPERVGEAGAERLLAVRPDRGPNCRPAGEVAHEHVRLAVRVASDEVACIRVECDAAAVARNDRDAARPVADRPVRADADQGCRPRRPVAHVDVVGIAALRGEVPRGRFEGHEVAVAGDRREERSTPGRELARRVDAHDLDRAAGGHRGGRCRQQGGGGEVNSPNEVHACLPSSSRPTLRPARNADGALAPTAELRRRAYGRERIGAPATGHHAFA